MASLSIKYLYFLPLLVYFLTSVSKNLDDDNPNRQTLNTEGQLITIGSAFSFFGFQLNYKLLNLFNHAFPKD
jgi:hypothetical protein